MSKDGVRRVNLRATIRVDRDELARLNALAKTAGRKLHEFLRDSLREGIYAEQVRQEEDAALAKDFEE